MMVELGCSVSFDPEEVGVSELVYYPALAPILEKQVMMKNCLRKRSEEISMT